MRLTYHLNPKATALIHKSDTTLDPVKRAKYENAAGALVGNDVQPGSGRPVYAMKDWWLSK